MVAPVGRELQMFCWLAAFAAAILLLGFLIAVPLTLYLYLRFDSHEPQWLSLAIALAGVVVIYGVFDQLLSVQLWDGFLPPMIMDWWSGE
jgi:Tripartite tricarboxylate transporter TctB family